MLRTKCAYNLIFDEFARKKSEHTSVRIGVTCGGKGGICYPPPPILLFTQEYFCGYRVEGQIQKLGEGGGKGVYVY